MFEGYWIISVSFFLPSSTVGTPSVCKMINMFLDVSFTDFPIFFVKSEDIIKWTKQQVPKANVSVFI